jgi:hypothetical protein
MNSVTPNKTKLVQELINSWDKKHFHCGQVFIVDKYVVRTAKAHQQISFSKHFHPSLNLYLFKGHEMRLVYSVR